ncbi:MAG: hypothetical protein ACE5LC_05065 [Candidatus Aminicenantales bacterium]
MAGQLNMMEKFGFLIGSWSLEYRVPKSAFSEAATGSGAGTIKRAMDDKYVYFDYSASLSSSPAQVGEAHAIFAWDEKAKIYRYWWFESSGNFLTATCNFVNKNTLFLNWHDTLLLQTFTKVSPNKVVLKMEHPIAAGKYELILEVIFTKK